MEIIVTAKRIITITTHTAASTSSKIAESIIVVIEAASSSTTTALCGCSRRLARTAEVAKVVVIVIVHTKRRSGRGSLHYRLRRFGLLVGLAEPAKLILTTTILRRGCRRGRGASKVVTCITRRCYLCWGWRRDRWGSRRYRRRGR